MKAIIPGSFDPMTYGHYEIIKRATQLFDEIVIVVGINVNKKGFFSIEERISFIKSYCKDLKNVDVCSYDGLMIRCAQTLHANAIVKGIRQVKDYEYEQTIATINRKIDPTIESIFLFADAAYAHISSSAVKELSSYQEDISSYVNEEVQQAFYKKYNRKNNP